MWQLADLESPALWLASLTTGSFVRQCEALGTGSKLLVAPKSGARAPFRDGHSAMRAEFSPVVERFETETEDEAAGNRHSFVIRVARPVRFESQATSLRIADSRQSGGLPRVPLRLNPHPSLANG